MPQLLLKSAKKGPTESAKDKAKLVLKRNPMMMFQYDIGDKVSELACEDTSEVCYDVC
jgi:hypothetical protein